MTAAGRVVALAGWAIVTLGAPAPVAPSAEKFEVIVGHDTAVPGITADDLARVYLGRKTLWNSGTRVVPCLVEDHTSAGSDFIDLVLRKTPAQYESYWRRLLFSGGGAPPRTFATSRQVVDFVARQAGAIGVVAGPVADPRVVVVEVSGSGALQK